ncbi:hypothetical protein Tco_1384252 [Tanacetum coccineum]
MLFHYSEVNVDDDVIEVDSSNTGEGKLSEEEVQEKASTETELFIQEVTPTEDASEEAPIVSTAEVNISTAGQTVMYTRRSAEKRSRQDKGKAIMIESEPKKKSKKELEQERQRAMAEAKSSKQIDWNDPSVIRPIFEKVWDFNQNIEPMDAEHGSEKQKSPEKKSLTEKRLVEEELIRQEEIERCC